MFHVLVLGALVATIAMTTVMSGSQMLGLSRMSIPFMLGTMFTSDRDRAAVMGFGVHVLNGLIFSALYFALFPILGGPSIWLGALLGAAHALFVLLVILPLLPSVHPRMATERDGPETPRPLEPPGFLGLNYGMRTPIVGVLTHALYGGILGLFAQLSS